MSTGFLIHLSTLIAIYSLLSVSLNLSLGFTGMINLGLITIYGVGAYTSAIFSEQGSPILLSILLGGGMASAVGYLLILLTQKLKGDYFAMATLSFLFITHNLLLNADELTKGTLGFTNIGRPPGLDKNLHYLFFVVFVSLLSIWIIKRVVDSPFGSLLQAVRDDEYLLRTMGKNPHLLKIKAFVLSSFFAGIAGGLFAHYIGYIHPDNFHLSEMIIILTIVIVGGLASLKGSLIGTFIIILLPELIRFWSLPQSIVGPSRQILYALVLIFILRFHSRGIFGKVDLD